MDIDWAYIKATTDKYQGRKINQELVEEMVAQTHKAREDKINRDTYTALILVMAWGHNFEIQQRSTNEQNANAQTARSKT